MDKIIEAQPLSVLRQGTRRAAGQHFTIELNETVKLAWPMVLTQPAQVAMMTTDLAFIGHIGPEALAAAALASRSISLASPLARACWRRSHLWRRRRMGRESCSAHCARAYGRRCYYRSDHSVCVSRRANTARFRSGSRRGAAPRQYLFGLALGVVPALWLQAIRNFMGAVNRPEPILWITLAAIPLKRGKFGLSRVELFGAALASTLVNCAMFLAGLWFATMRRPFRNYHVLADPCQTANPDRNSNFNRLPDAVGSFVGCGAPVA